MGRGMGEAVRACLRAGTQAPQAKGPALCTELIGHQLWGLSKCPSLCASVSRSQMEPAVVPTPRDSPED